MDWEFLQYLLRRMGFGIKWRGWISKCLSSATFSICINGSPFSFFSASRGLRLGDLLSPFLFAVIGEALGRMLQAANNANLSKGVCPSNDDQVVSTTSLLMIHSNSVVLMRINFVMSRPSFYASKRCQVLELTSLKVK